MQEPAAPADGNGAEAAPAEASDEPKTTDALVADAIKGDEEVFIVVTQVGSNTFGIIVDRVFDTEEIVVKPVAPILRDITFYSGNTILGDGVVLEVRKTANLHCGGTIHDVTDELHPDLRAAAIKARQVLQIPVVGFDFMVPRVDGPDYRVIEANERLAGRRWACMRSATRPRSPRVMHLEMARGT